jgi:hypothetical protein
MKPEHSVHLSLAAMGVFTENPKDHHVWIAEGIGAVGRDLEVLHAAIEGGTLDENIVHDAVYAAIRRLDGLREAVLATRAPLRWIEPVSEQGAAQ